MFSSLEAWQSAPTRSGISTCGFSLRCEGKQHGDLERTELEVRENRHGFVILPETDNLPYGAASDRGGDVRSGSCAEVLNSETRESQRHPSIVQHLFSWCPACKAFCPRKVPADDILRSAKSPGRLIARTVRSGCARIRDLAIWEKRILVKPLVKTQARKAEGRRAIVCAVQVCCAMYARIE